MSREDIEYHLKENESLDDFLINSGVRKESLIKAQNSKVDYHFEFDYYYDYVEKQTDLAWVDTDFIYAPARSGNQGYSWYDLLKWGVYGVPKDQEINVAAIRFYDLLDNLTKMSFEELQKLYEDGQSGLSSYNFTKYEKKGEAPIYIGSGDGTHRIILAKVLGINYVTSNRIYRYEFNNYKYKVYQELKLIIKKINDFIDNSTVFKLIEDDDNNKYVSINVKEFTYMGVLLEEVSGYIFNKNIDRYVNYVEKLKHYYKHLQNIENAYNKEINAYKYVPKNLLNHLSLAHRDIYLEELDEKEQLFIKKVKIMKAIDSKSNS